MRSEDEIRKLLVKIDAAVDRRPNDQEVRSVMHALDWVMEQASDEFMQLYVDDSPISEVIEPCE